MPVVAVELTNNYPPIADSVADLLDYLQQRLEAETFAIASRRDALLAAASRIPPITSDEISGKVADFVKQLTEHGKTAAQWKDEAKVPVLKLDRAIMAQHAALVDPIEAVKRQVLSRQTDYLAAKERAERERREQEAREAAEMERVAREEAERAAAAAETPAELEAAIIAEAVAEEAAEIAAEAEALTNAKSTDLTRVTGHFGTTTSLRKEWVFLPETINMQSIDLESLRPYLKPDDLHKALRAAIRAGRHEIKGVTIKEQAKAR